MRRCLLAERLPTRFEPSQFEEKWYAIWEKSGAFTPELPSSKPPFVILIPPPNVTGKLHIGHALQFTLQDVMIRFKRMDGFNALWLPGTDHAGIATQVMVERELAKEGLSRHQLGRKKFLERMWSWKHRYASNISSQAKALGASCDWTRERFTLDPMLSRAVIHAFVTLYNQGLIYRAHRLINWCPRCLTALSDLEVVHKEIDGGLWDFAYPVEGGGELVVSTTRPETMLGDTAVAVHPEDDRYRHLIGRFIRHPFVDRRIPIIADPILVDPGFGTGAVKVTPAHDPNDFATAERHNLPKINILTEDGRINEEGGRFAGLDRFAARKAVLEALGELGLRRGEKPHRHAVGHCQRCETVLEPFLSLQWFVKTKPLAEVALEAVRKGEIRIHPEFWVATYENWLSNILDWCISRQLWWGHRIPAFYCPQGHTTVSEQEPSNCPVCGEPVEQDPDVLDTWFSSALWPLSTLGWPEETQDLRYFYPTQLLITGFDILFFWVARMIMMGYHFRGRPPFLQVHLTGLVRDARGQKMSKTKGNVMDPLELVGQYGADAVRFTLAALASPGRDLPLDTRRMEGYRAFGTKLWNAARLVQMHLTGEEGELADLSPDELGLPERWILGELTETTAGVREALESFRFDEACRRLYHFTWHSYCDWFLELAKAPLAGGSSERSPLVVRTVARGVLLETLKLLHPIMPFITEELASHLGFSGLLLTTPYPKVQAGWRFEEERATFQLIQGVVQGVRSYRHLVGLPPGAPVSLVLVKPEPAVEEGFSQLREEIVRLASLTGLNFVQEIPSGAVRDAVGGLHFGLLLPSGVFGEEERARLARELATAREEQTRVEARLADDGFLQRAPAVVVEQTRTRQQELTHRIQLLEETLGAVR
ncbi:MAG: valine--tRNA ligase [Thermoanaerobaculaceae bacterium]